MTTDHWLDLKDWPSSGSYRLVHLLACVVTILMAEGIVVMF